MKVRRKLAIQEGLPNSDMDDSTQDTGGISMFTYKGYYTSGHFI